MTNFEKIKQMSVEEMADFLDYSVWKNENYQTVIDKKVFINTSDIAEWLESEVLESE